PQPASIDGAGVKVWSLTLGDSPKWEALCATGARPLAIDGVALAEHGLFVTSAGSAWRFDPSLAICR
ncbi:MAG: hypothetical protein ACHREM_17825, partial [Polyangiales bacterium]